MELSLGSVGSDLGVFCGFKLLGQDGKWPGESRFSSLLVQGDRLMYCNVVIALEVWVRF